MQNKKEKVQESKQVKVCGGHEKQYDRPCVLVELCPDTVVRNTVCKHMQMWVFPLGALEVKREGYFWLRVLRGHLLFHHKNYN